MRQSWWLDEGRAALWEAAAGTAPGWIKAGIVMGGGTCYSLAFVASIYEEARPLVQGGMKQCLPPPQPHRVEEDGEKLLE